MASKSAQHEPEKAEVIEELLDHCDTTLDRVKVLYEQFFLGIQKQPPTHLHTDVERKLRELQQLQIRNTALRYRFATVQQKFGSYNNYWRRTLRQIENGTYHRNLAKIGRQAAQTGEDIPDEILAAMPKRMREQVKRDREAALAMKRRREGTSEEADFLEEQDTNVGTKKTRTGAHVLEDDGEFDLDAYFAAVTNEDAPDQTTPDMPVFAPPRTPARAAPPASVNDDPPTDVPAQIVSRPAPITNSPIQHASPAVRAAVGMRTPPAGLPRVSPGYQQTQPLPNMNRASGGFPAVHTQPGHASGQHPATGHATGRSDATGQSHATGQSGTLPPPPGPVPSPPPSGLPPVPPPPGHRPGLAPSQVSRPLSVMPGASNARGPVAVESMSGPFPREQPAGATMSGIRGAAPATTRMPTAPDATRPGMPATTRMPTAPDAPRPNMPATTRMPTAPDATRPGMPATTRMPTAPDAMPATTRMPTAPDAMRPNVPATTRMPTAPDAMRPNVPATTRMPTAPDAPRPGMPASTMRLPTSPGATASTRAATAPDAPRSGMPAATREPMAPDAPRPNMPATTRRPAAPDAMRPNVPATTRMPAAPDATTPGMPAAPARPSGPHPGARTAPGMGPRPGAPPAPPRPPPPPGAERPFKPRIQTEPGVKPAPARVGPPPGMTDADVNALYSKYVKAKEAVGEKTGPGSYGKLLQTINAQAPKIMEQYKAKGVDFQVVVKDNQVVIRAKPKP